MIMLWTEAVTSQGVGRFNEDRSFIDGSIACVIDGATGLGVSHFETTSDAAWFAEHLAHALRATVMQTNSLTEALDQALDKVMELVRQQNIPWTENVETFMLPSATIAIARVRNKELEFLVLGDCYIAVDIDELPIRV